MNRGDEFEMVSVGASRELDPCLARKQGLGGTSATWTGRVATLDPIESDLPPWVPESGWLISREHSGSFYARAAVCLGAVVNNFSDQGFLEQIAAQVPRTDRRLLTPYVRTFSRLDPIRRGLAKLAASENSVPRHGVATLTEQAIAGLREPHASAHP